MNGEIKLMDDKLKKAIEDMVLGKEDGFNAVYSATYNYVYFRAKSLMKDEADAQDLTQIVYIEAYKNIKSLQNSESIFGWLNGICTNQGMKIFRKKKDVLQNVDEDGMDIFENLESNDLSSLPELTTDQKETSRIIQEFIDELPELQKAAVIAYYFDGFSVSEIAQMQDCSEGTVKSRLNYARKFLKDKVEGTEKRDGIRLHVVALPTLWYAIKLMSENTKLSAKAANLIYAESCAKVGLTPGVVAIGNAGAGVSAKMAASGFAKAAAVTGAGLSAGIKALIIAGVITVGAAGAGVGYYVTKLNSQGLVTEQTAENTVVDGNSLNENDKANAIYDNNETEENVEESAIEETADTELSEEDDKQIYTTFDRFTVEGTIFEVEEDEKYSAELKEYKNQYNPFSWNPYNIRFSEPIYIDYEGEVLEISEAGIGLSGENGAFPYTVEDMLNKTMVFEGQIGIGVDSDYKEISQNLYSFTTLDGGEGKAYLPNYGRNFMIYSIVDIKGNDLNTANSGEKSKELYEKFLNNEILVHFSPKNNMGTDSYLDLSNYYEKDFSVDELIDAVVGYLKKDWGDEFVILEEVDYAYIDCGDDGNPELVLHIISPIPDYESWNEYIVIKNIDGRLETIYTNIAWSRSPMEINEYGYITASGDGGAYNYGDYNSFLDAEGNYYDTYKNHVEINPDINEYTDNIETEMSEEESSDIGLTQKIKDGNEPEWIKLK